MSCANDASTAPGQGATYTNLYAGVHFVLRPTPSDRSEAFSKDPPASESPSSTTRSSRTSKSGRTLARLMDMPMEIWFEIMTLLHPRDLLSLCRLSRHFRKILMSRSSKGIWNAARKNARDLPPPPDCLSEPSFASVLFDHDCQACGAPHAGFESFGLSLRLCSACCDENIVSQDELLQTHKALGPIADTIFSLLFMIRDGYYEAEVQAITERYASLSGKDQDNFVEQRLAYIETMQEHEKAVLAWQRRVGDKHRSDIIARLFEMGYSKDDFPWGPFSRKWHSLLSQPRELTEQAWKQLLPQLEEQMSRQAKRKKWLRRNKRMYEVYDILEACLTELPPTGEKVLTTYIAIRESEEISKLVDENDTDVPITRGDIEAILPDILKRQTDENFARYMDALRHALSLDTLDNGAEPQPLPDLDSAIALFPCCECDNEVEVVRNYTLTELAQHTKETHLVRGAYNTVKSADEALPVNRTQFHVETVRQVLRMLGLPEDTRYEDVSGKVICLCGRFTSEQLPQFSSLIHHIREAQRQDPDDRHEGDLAKTQSYCDHNFDQFPPFLRLLHDDGSFVPPELVLPKELVQLPPA